MTQEQNKALCTWAGSCAPIATENSAAGSAGSAYPMAMMNRSKVTRTHRSGDGVTRAMVSVTTKDELSSPRTSHIWPHVPRMSSTAPPIMVDRAPPGQWEFRSTGKIHLSIAIHDGPPCHRKGDIPMGWNEVMLEARESVKPQRSFRNIGDREMNSLVGEMHMEKQLTNQNAGVLTRRRTKR